MKKKSKTSNYAEIVTAGLTLSSNSQGYKQMDKSSKDSTYHSNQFSLFSLGKKYFTFLQQKITGA